MVLPVVGTRRRDITEVAVEFLPRQRSRAAVRALARFELGHLEEALVSFAIQMHCELLLTRCRHMARAALQCRLLLLVFRPASAHTQQMLQLLDVPRRP